MQRRTIFAITMLCIILLACNSNQQQSSKLSQEELFVDIVAANKVLPISKIGDLIKIPILTNFPLETVFFIETGDTKDLSDTPHSSTTDSFTLKSPNFSTHIPKSYFPAYMKIQVYEEKQKKSVLAQINSLLSNYSKEFPKPLGENDACIFETIYMLSFNLENAVIFQKDHIGVRKNTSNPE